MSFHTLELFHVFFSISFLILMILFGDIIVYGERLIILGNAIYYKASFFVIVIYCGSL